VARARYDLPAFAEPGRSHPVRSAETMPIRIVRGPMMLDELRGIARGQFGDMVKAVVDVERGVMAIGAELHSDEEALLLEEGSRQRDLWGINLYPEHRGTERVEFDSMINVRPSQGNRSRAVEDPAIQHRIRQIVTRLVLE
jgi:hypothetical protein